MLIQKICAITSISLLALGMTACQKNESTPASTASTPASIATDKPATNSAVSASNATAKATSNIPTLSPSMQFWVETNQGLINKMLEKDHPNMTEKQKLCLKSVEGWSNYESILKPYTQKILTPQDIAEADKFYGSTTGMQFATQLKKQIVINNPNMPDMPLSAEQKKEIAAAMKQPFMAKMQKATNDMSEADAMKFAQSMADLELKRCNIQ